MTITVTMLRQNRAMLHCVCEALGIAIADIDLTAFWEEDQGRWLAMADEDLRAAVNGSMDDTKKHPVNKHAYALLTGHTHPDAVVLPVLRAHDCKAVAKAAEP
jgi:hypothetical protein